MTVKRDRVNRVQGLVYLPIDGSLCIVGDVVTLRNVVEKNIDPPWEKDPQVMRDPVTGDAFGDALFDAAAPGSSDVYTDARKLTYVLDELTKLPILDELTNLPILDEDTHLR